MNPTSTSNSQNFNRFSYVLNNPLKYVDPSGYNYNNIDWAYSYGTGNGGPRHWKQELDYIYNRGEYSLGGGFGGLGKFYYVNGKGYQITSSGSIISTNKNDQGTNAFYRGDDFGFYAQTSGSVIYATKNGRTEGVATSDVRCDWVSAGDPLPAWNDRGWRFYGMPEDQYLFDEDNGNFFSDRIWSISGNATAALTFFGVSIDVGFLIDFNKYQTRGFLTISRAAGIDFSYGGKITYYEPINDKRKLNIYSIKDWGSSITTSVWIFDYSSGGDEKNSSLYLKDINTNYSNYKSYSFGISNGLPIGTSITKGKTFIYGQ